MNGENRIADYYENVSVFFSDIVGFTRLSQKVSPDELVEMLNQIFTEFDRLARKYGLEKIKTIGDAYMAAAGVPNPADDHAARVADFALAAIESMKRTAGAKGDELQIRIGLHCGSVVAGVIGEDKFTYDLWGDAVNTAARMESHGTAGQIQVTEAFKNAAGDAFAYIDRGEIEVKGKGATRTYYLIKKE